MASAGHFTGCSFFLREKEAWIHTISVSTSSNDPQIAILKDLVRSLIDIIPFSLIKQTGKGRLIVPYYHIVNNEDVPHVSHLYKYKGIGQFRDDLEFLLKQYSPIGLSDVIDWVRGKTHLPPDSFALTFDDGFREIYDVIAPLLLKKAIPATFFVSSAFLDNRELCYQHKASILVDKIQKEGISLAEGKTATGVLSVTDFSSAGLSEAILKVDYANRKTLDRIAAIIEVDFEEYLVKRQPYLTSGQVKDLITRGFAIGSHSIDHPYYKDLSLDEQLKQTVVSVGEIRDKFDLAYGAFAFPHNDDGVFREFFERIQESGLVDVTFGTDGMVDSGLPIHRQRLSLEKPLLPARDLIARQYARRLYKKWA
jgi:peptidoglycan/xylan/chitin deacetylase (PgdA/CDA1 family)